MNLSPAAEVTQVEFSETNFPNIVSVLQSALDEIATKPCCNMSTPSLPVVINKENAHCSVSVNCFEWVIDESMILIKVHTAPSVIPRDFCDWHENVSLIDYTYRARRPISAPSERERCGWLSFSLFSFLWLHNTKYDMSRGITLGWEHHQCTWISPSQNKSWLVDVLVGISTRWRQTSRCNRFGKSHWHVQYNDGNIVGLNGKSNE